MLGLGVTEIIVIAVVALVPLTALAGLIVLAVKLVMLNGASMTSVLPITPRYAPRATCPPA